MRFVLYNIRYGTGGKRFNLHKGGYLGKTGSNLKRIITFLKKQEPDIICLLEVDAGSYRSGGKNQAETIAQSLNHYHTYRSKYGTASFVQKMPLFAKQGNAFVSKDNITKEKIHFFEKGMKRLVLELELQDLTIFLVHLSLPFRVRHHQLTSLCRIVKGAKKPHIVAGDFNSFFGAHELELFRTAVGLTSADPEERPTFPSWAPKHQLDFILYSPGIKIKSFKVPDVDYSDHLPLVCDIEVENKKSHR